MRNAIIYFDLIGGASGDMLLSALLDVGFKRSSLERLTKALGFDDVRVVKTKAEAGHIYASKIGFVSKNEIDLSFFKIKARINKAKISGQVKEKAIATYTALVKIEEKIHGHSHRDFRFQHLGKLDAIIEITGFWLALEELGVERAFCSLFPLSNTSPATLQLLQGKKVRFTDWGYETVTPTAAALLKGFAQEEVMLTPMKVGYGAGDASAFQQPDYLRVVIAAAQGVSEEILKLEVNIDDMNPQVVDYVMESLFGLGALDVYITPIIMKKSRPAYVLSVLLKSKDLPAIEKVLFTQTTTFGVRFTEFKRHKLEYRFVRKETPFGKIQFRCGSLNGKYTKAHPEYNDCKKAAAKYNIPLLEVYKRLAGKS